VNQDERHALTNGATTVASFPACFLAFKAQVEVDRYRVSGPIDHSTTGPTRDVVAGIWTLRRDELEGSDGSGLRNDVRSGSAGIDADRGCACVDAGGVVACVDAPGLCASVNATGARIDAGRCVARRVIGNSGSVEEGDDDDDLEGCHVEEEETVLINVMRVC
jgi:hypothetical protein